MPCDTIQTTNVVFSMEHTDTELLKKAMVAQGWTDATYGQSNLSFYKGSDMATFNKGTMNLRLGGYGRDQDRETNTIKRAYSTEVVKAQAKRFGWKLKERSPGKFLVEKAGK